jgi:two-component system, chemotaxis family, chemotaxis protein CheY
MALDVLEMDAMDIHAMVVDDSGIMRKLVMKSLNETKLASFMFTEAVDGADALTKFDPASIQMLFVDWNMPNMTGIEFVRKIRTERASNIPIVMVTTEGTMGKVEEAMDQCAVNGYVVKPFTADALRVKIEPILDKLAQARKAPTGFFGKLAAKLA